MQERKRNSVDLIMVILEKHWPARQREDERSSVVVVKSERVLSNTRQILIR